MKIYNNGSLLILLIATILGCGIARAETAALSDTALDASTVLAVVPVKNGNVNQSVYRQFDRLVPELKKISKQRIVKLNCSHFGQPDSEQDVAKAFNLVARIEKYLRIRHRLDLDLWLTIDVSPKAVKSSPVLTLAVFSDEIKKLDTVLIDPRAKNINTDK